MSKLVHYILQVDTSIISSIFFSSHIVNSAEKFSQFSLDKREVAYYLEDH